MSQIEYRPLTALDARPTQELVLQDLTEGGFPNPSQTANPWNPFLLLRQIKRIKENPQNYLGAEEDGSLVGITKIGPWNIRDEKPFATPEELAVLQALEAEGNVLTPERKIGVFALVASNRLEEPAKLEIASSFLSWADERAIDLGATAINIPFHNHDYVREVAEQQGYVFTGRTGEADGAEGVEQKLFVKAV